MFTKYKECELLSPGGSVDSIKAAVSAGCDAVYVGGSNFSARASANNLTDEQLFDMIEYLHLRNKRIYLAVNTLIKNSELKSLYEYMVLMYEQGVDAFIVQDFGVLHLLSEYLPNVEIHASTQMAVSGSTAINFLQKNFALSRVVLPRELNLNQIKEIAGNTKVDLECFGHGALCYSYSGQCLMSSLICGRSGNRGRCSQSCRLPYSYNKQTPSYLLSLKELNTITLLPDMIKAGVNSLKLEGRMRSPSYVGAITSIYRKYLDSAVEALKKKMEYKVEKKDLKSMESIFNRSGFTNSYLMNNPGSNMVSFHTSSAKSNEEVANSVVKQSDKAEILEVNAKLTLNTGKPAFLSLACQNKKKQVQVYASSSQIVEIAKSKALDYGALQRRISKADNEYFLLNQLEIEQDNPAFMPVSALNELRRTAYDKLKKAIIEKNGFKTREKIKSHPILDLSVETIAVPSEKREISACVQNMEQLFTVKKRSFISRIYLETDELLKSDKEEIKEKLDKIQAELKPEQSLFLALPHLYEEGRNNIDMEIFQMFEASFVSGYLVRNMEELAFLNKLETQKAVITDYLLYIMNVEAVKFFNKFRLQGMNLPIELNNKELEFFTKRIGMEVEMLIFGYPIAMVSKNCVKKNHNACDHLSSFSYISDRKKYRFPVKNNCSSCYNLIYNSQKIFLADLLNTKLKKLKIDRYRLDFTDETKEEILMILDDIDNFMNQKQPKLTRFNYSRGHLNRGID